MFSTYLETQQNKDSRIYAIKNLSQIIYGGDSNGDISLFEALIDSYVKSGKIDYARRLFDRVLINPNVMCSTSLISGYMSAGVFDEAETMFKSIDEKDVGVFNAMIEGYSRSTDTAKKSVEMYFDMLRSGFLPNVSTITSLLAEIEEGTRKIEKGIGKIEREAVC